MPKIELDIPTPFRIAVSDLNESLQIHLTEDLHRSDGAAPMELITGHEIHMLALNEAYRLAGPDNENLLPLVTRPTPEGYHTIGAVFLKRVRGLYADGQPLTALQFGKIPECPPVISQRAIDDIIEIANEKLLEIGIPPIPER